MSRPTLSSPAASPPASSQPASSQPSPEIVADIRRRYQAGETVTAIKAATGITSSELFYGCIDGRLDDGSGATPPPLPRRYKSQPRVNTTARRRALVDRIWRNASRQVAQIERGLSQYGIATAETDRDARALAVLVRTLRELAQISETMAREQAKTAHDDAVPNDSHDPVPQDIDELRRELARRMQNFVRERTDGRLSE